MSYSTLGARGISSSISGVGHVWGIDNPRFAARSAAFGQRNKAKYFFHGAGEKTAGTQASHIRSTLQTN